MPFYVGDWLKCPEVRALPPDYRGLWFDLICFMWESTERGVMVKPNGKPYSDSDIVRIVGLDNQNSGIWLTHLLDNEVCSRRSDGSVYSKRMVKDEQIREIRRKVGAKGGNPHLLVNHILNQGSNQNANQIIENESEYEIETVKEVFSYFCLMLSKKIQLTPERKDIITKRLKEGRTIEEMKTAIYNFSKDDWPDRYKHCDIVYCLGTRNKVNNLDRWLSHEPTSAPRPV